MLRIKGESLTGTEPAETRWRKSLMSRGVGFGGSDSAVGVVGWLLGDAVAAAVWGAGTALFGDASGSVRGGDGFVDWLLGYTLVGSLGRLAVTGAESVDFAATGEVLVGVLTAVLGVSEGCFPVDLALVLLFEALSSSDEMSTTIWANIMGRRPWQDWDLEPWGFTSSCVIEANSRSNS